MHLAYRSSTWRAWPPGMRWPKIFTPLIGFTRVRPVLCSSRTALRTLSANCIPPDRAPPPFGAPNTVRFRNCGQNTLIVRRLGTENGAKHLYIPLIRVICSLFYATGASSNRNSGRNAGPRGFRSRFPVPIGAQSGYFDQTSKNERRFEGEMSAFHFD